MYSKDHFDILIIFFGVLLFISCDSFQINEVGKNEEIWKRMDAIEETIDTPLFPDLTVNILDYGAVSDTLTINSQAFRKAIAFCNSRGGGKVLVPKGVYVTGPIHLYDNINLHLEDGAEIRFSTSTEDYYPLVHTSFEGIELMNYSPFIYAYGKTNIAITGKGILNGQANENNWWTWKGSKDYGFKIGMPSQKDSLNLPRLMSMGQKGTPVEDRIFGEGHYLRPSFIEPFNCKNVLIQDVRIINAPFWVIHPIKSQNVTIDNVYVESHGPNNDGCDPEYSKNVIIKNSVFNTGDDCIAIKSGRDAEGRRVSIPSENIIIRNCKMIDGHGGVVVGSEMSAGVRNVFVENCTMDSSNLERAIRIKTNTRRGGVVDGIYVRNLSIGEVKEAILKVNMQYATYKNQTGDFIPVVKNIYLNNVRVQNGGEYVVKAQGYPSSLIQNINLNNVMVENVNMPFMLEHTEPINLNQTYINGKLIKNSL